MTLENDHTQRFIFGISGLDLTDEEKVCLDQIMPFGIILFRKNCDSKEQIQKLTSSIKAASPVTTIFIDQEGGRVQRIKPENGGMKDYPTQQYWGDLYRDAIDDQGKKEVLQKLYDNYYQLGQELKELGVDVTFAPVCDLYYKKQSKVIGDRSFSHDLDIVISLANRALQALKDSGIEGVIKHLPGHGRATKDSHRELPRVDSSLEELEETDFRVYSSLASNASMAMTAHIVFSCIDNKNPVTQSKKAIDYIRNKIGFQGLIITDDIRMKSLKGTMKDRAQHAFQAGCDIVMCCNNISECVRFISYISSYNGDVLF